MFHRSECRSGPGSDPVAGGGSSLEGLGRGCGHGHRESGENQETCTQLESLTTIHYAIHYRDWIIITFLIFW